MGSSGSKPQVHYTDNSGQINQSINNIRAQISELNSDLTKYQEQVNTHIEVVQNNFKIFDSKVKLIQNEFERSFDYLNCGIKMIGCGINQMAQLQISYEKSNDLIHWEIFQNDWKENLERNIFQEFQRLKNMKFELELDLHKKVGTYLLIKDRFNDKIKIYEQKKNTYQIQIIQTQVSWLLTNHNSKSSELVQIPQISQSNYVEEELELKSLETDIRYPPELDNGVEQMYMMTERFEEIARVEDNLIKSISLMRENFTNPNLLNPLDVNVVKPVDFATKLYNSGINCVKQIQIPNQSSILISNGYAYVPEYKYKDLRKKFILGSEQANLKLDWESEDIGFVSTYLYSKISNKSVSNMIGLLKQTDSIYRLGEKQITDSKFIGKLGFEFHKALDRTNKISLEYETNPLILYNIFVGTDTKNINQITKELIVSYGYLEPSDYAISNLQNLLIQIDKHEIYGAKLLESIRSEQIEPIITNGEKLDHDQLVKYVVSAFLNKKKTDKHFTFEFDKLDGLVVQSFFTEIVSKLLGGYIGMIKDKLINTSYTDIEFSTKELNQINLCVGIDFDLDIVGPIFKFNKITDVKVFIGFVFFNLYNFYWNKTTTQF